MCLHLTDSDLRSSARQTHASKNNVDVFMITLVTSLSNMWQYISCTRCLLDNVLYPFQMKSLLDPFYSSMYSLFEWRPLFHGNILLPEIVKEIGYERTCPLRLLLS